MPDFFVQPTASPALEFPPWEDEASSTKPSRITGSSDRSYRRVNASINSTLTLTAVLYGQTSPQPDSAVGRFTMWPIEVPAGGGNPLQTIPTPGTSAVQTFVLGKVGHYTFAVRHENTRDAPNAVAGGVVVLHVESMMVD
jgi:hypothetical protein